MNDAAVLLVAVVNHEHTEAALALKRGFGAAAETVLIDSGSRLTPEQAEGFDVVLPNVYWCGLLNSAVELARDRGAQGLYLVASDVTFPSYEEAVRRAAAALARPGIGVYAPSASADTHAQMVRRPGGRLRPGGFVNGYAFAARTELLGRLCPVNTDLNAIGYGVDVHLGYLALRHGLKAVVDDGFSVVHRVGTGYSKEEAFRQQARWLADEVRWSGRVFREVATWPLHNPVGLAALRLLARL